MNYELYGLRIGSDLPLNAPASSDGAVDLEVSWGQPLSATQAPPAGRVLAHAVWGGGQGYTHTETPQGYVLQFHGICELRVDRDRARMQVHLVPGADPGMAALLVSGNALAFLLMLGGECVLHASAVRLGRAALAFVGAPGMGKSTLAALLCAAGAQLVTDDVLRLSQGPTGFRCYPGTGEIRLRPGAAALAAGFHVAEETVDGRIALRPDHVGPTLPGLDAIVIPYPSRTERTPQVEQLTGYRTLVALLRHPRVLGLCAPELLRRQFEVLGRVARSVPVYEARIPWGPPFDPDLPEALLGAVGIAHHAAPVPA